MSRSQQNRFRVAFEIAQYDAFVIFSYDRCLFFNRYCVVMESSSRLKCFECVRSKKSCFNLSWETLDKTREKYKKKIQFNEKELTKVISRLLRNKRILQQIDEKTKRKIKHLLEELNQFDELETFNSWMFLSLLLLPFELLKNWSTQWLTLMILLQQLRTIPQVLKWFSRVFRGEILFPFYQILLTLLFQNLFDLVFSFLLWLITKRCLYECVRVCEFQ